MSCIMEYLFRDNTFLIACLQDKDSLFLCANVYAKNLHYMCTVVNVACLVNSKKKDSMGDERFISDLDFIVNARNQCQIV